MGSTNTARNLEVDDAWIVRGANTSTRSNPNPPNTRRKLLLAAYLIAHPTHGLILFETGAGTDYPEIVGPQVDDLFSRVDYDASMNLDAQIALTGHSIRDVKMVIMGHLHLDHAGGLEYFKGTNVPIYVHELELKYAFYSVATKIDNHVYLPHYLTFDYNWVPLHGSHVDYLAPGLTVHHAPGHTPGLCILQLHLKRTGTWLFTSDMYHVVENYRDTVPQGWLVRDYEAWFRSHAMVKGIVGRTGAKVLLGHCWDTVRELGVEFAPRSYE
ncbi:similar to beta-lactamase domain protein [Plenodomus lingam JN3]|uniref:Similar to beta-lactamase domain protein n=1 Tax=Leptosphaeria maculans (strain JN3 / isolate v23.1.3 / race Av1-4-5-6-7-8) TaxID=985895 RepID=E4ZVK1_LEPMJ|nr:similar to beta-lactamase domain protein [Plenodomus lingam JN3]CBX95627.1 similar to beta-lactamase domain protein [Plenodomus lingam JN3]